ncbi:MAG: trypsin-like serine protease [Ruminococcus flavefaciens]|nr:trypsin-like serine protease [Ruminococcus flavefaciens]MCM1360546.1 trypsin-like serine protease [Clostridiales bacterium]MCM1435855.1 trypsin-like serine protease [Ruminococcus flavefaciens]
MKVKSRIIAFLSTAMVAAASVMSFSGSAAQNVVYNDPTGDGKIDMSDAVVIMQYLSGAITPENVDKLDFDNNGVVTPMDSYKVQMYKLQMLGDKDDIVTIASPEAVSPQGDSSVNYRVYDAQTRKELTSKRYTLKESKKYYNDSDNSISTRAVIGDTDDRVIDWTKNGVVKLMTTGGYMGSGFVVDEHTIATAAHCVYNNSMSSLYNISSIKLFDNNGVTILDIAPEEIHIPEKYFSDNIYDYALITVEEDLSDYMQFDLGTVLNYSPSRNIAVTNTGFPQYIYVGNSKTTVNDGDKKHNMYSSTGSIVRTKDKYFYHTVDTSGGDSGSPVYYTETINGQTYYTVVGIHVRRDTDPSDDIDANEATRITTELIRFYKQNPNIN